MIFSRKWFFFIIYRDHRISRSFFSIFRGLIAVKNVKFRGNFAVKNGKFLGVSRSKTAIFAVFDGRKSKISRHFAINDKFRAKNGKTLIRSSSNYCIWNLAILKLDFKTKGILSFQNFTTFAFIMIHIYVRSIQLSHNNFASIRHAIWHGTNWQIAAKYGRMKNMTNFK